MIYQTPDYYFSIVADRHNTDNLLTRSRMPKAIERFFGVPETFDPSCDYHYRASIPRLTVASRIMADVAGIDYESTKGAIKDPVYLKAYHEAWTAYARVQPGRPWQTGRFDDWLIEGEYRFEKHRQDLEAQTGDYRRRLAAMPDNDHERLTPGEAGILAAQRDALELEDEDPVWAYDEEADMIVDETSGLALYAPEDMAGLSRAAIDRLVELHNADEDLDFECAREALREEGLLDADPETRDICQNCGGTGQIAALSVLQQGKTRDEAMRPCPACRPDVAIQALREQP